MDRTQLLEFIHLNISFGFLWLLQLELFLLLRLLLFFRLYLDFETKKHFSIEFEVNLKQTKNKTKVKA